MRPGAHYDVGFWGTIVSWSEGRGFGILVLLDDLFDDRRSPSICNVGSDVVCDVKGFRSFWVLWQVECGYWDKHPWIM